MLKKIHNHNFTESQHVVKKYIVWASQKNKKFLQKVAKLVDGHYDIPLLFGRGNVQLLNNKRQAGKIVTSLNDRMTRNGKFKDKYMTFVNDSISKGYNKESKNVLESGHCWYFSHHGV